MNDKDPLQLLLVVETSEEDKSDTIYINEVLRRYFDLSDINIQWIPLDGKTHYKDKKIQSRINSLTRMFKSNANGSTTTIYFIDTDSTKKEYKPGSFFYNLQEFVKEKGYELVWFCKNAENVFLHVEPGSLDNKTEAAKEFAVKNGIESIKKEALSKIAIELNCSNILVVLSKYIPEK